MSEPTSRDEDLNRVEDTTSSRTDRSAPADADPASPPMPLADPSSPMDAALAVAFGLSNSTDILPSVAVPAVGGQLIGGKYKLIQAIGEGGMGSVWLAEQKQPVKRKVAVKLVKAGMDSRLVLARFEAERQALALMDHPNIAKVLDGGATEHGRPYFVMELVKGIPLTEYCDQVQFSIRERLELFGQVCSAVQHAHQKGIIHRDLKPSNVLVTEVDGRPIVKVIDFGLAKALHGSQVLTDLSMHTAFGAVLGTPLYMAPEQLGTSALDVDTRADLYSLGVILYELLTGTTPIERQQLKQAAFEEMCRLIREQEPPRPSTRLVDLLEETVRGYKATLGDGNKDTLLAMSNLGMAYQAVGDTQQAVRVTQEVLQKMRIKLGVDHPTTLQTLNGLGAMLWSTKEYEKASEIFAEILPVQRQILGSSHEQTRLTVFNLGVNYLAAGRLEQALPLLEEAHENNIAPPKHVVIWELRKAYVQLGRAEDTERLTNEYLSERRSHLSADRLVVLLLEFAEDYRRLGLSPQSLGMLQDALNLATSESASESRAMEVKSRLGLGLLESAENGLEATKLNEVLLESEGLLRQAYEHWKSQPVAAGSADVEIMDRNLDGLIRVNQLRGDPDREREWQKEKEILRDRFFSLDRRLPERLQCVQGQRRHVSPRAKDQGLWVDRGLHRLES
jgi:serine/threonine protein kinase